MDLSPKQFSEIITFTRSGTATRVNANLDIETVAANTPRFDYHPVTREFRGLLIEDGRTNLALFSDAFDNAAWIKGSTTITANAGTSLDGSVSADKLIPNSTIALTSALLAQNLTKAATATTYTFSVFAQAAELNRIQLLVNDQAASVNQASVTVSLVDGSIVTAAAVGGTFTNASAVVTPYKLGWYRIALTYTTSTETGHQIRIYTRDSGVSVGDGTSGILIWGAQLEQSAIATSYIPTASTTAFRGAENPVIGSGIFGQVSNPNEGTIVVAVEPFATGNGAPRFAEINDGTSSNRILIYATSSRQAALLVTTGGVARVSQAVVNKWNVGTAIKVGVAFAAGDTAFSVDGNLQTSAVAWTMPANMSQLGVGCQPPAAGNALNGWIKSLRYFPNRLPNATLQALTA